LETFDAPETAAAQTQWFLSFALGAGPALLVPGVTRLKHRIDQTAVLVEGYRRRIGARIAVEPSSRDPGIALPVVVVVSRPDNCGHAGVGETGSGTRGHWKERQGERV